MIEQWRQDDFEPLRAFIYELERGEQLSFTMFARDQIRLLIERSDDTELQNNHLVLDVKELHISYQ